MKRKTIADLEYKIKNLEPYTEAYLALSKGETKVIVRSGDHSVSVLGLHRACGGVVIEYGDEPGCVRWVSDVAADYAKSYDPYLKDVASKLYRLQKDAVDARYAKRSEKEEEASQ